MLERTEQVNTEGRPGHETYPGARAELDGGFAEAQELPPLVREEREQHGSRPGAPQQARAAGLQVFPGAIGEVCTPGIGGTARVGGSLRGPPRPSSTPGRDAIGGSAIPLALVGLGLAWWAGASPGARSGARPDPAVASLAAGRHQPGGLAWRLGQALDRNAVALGALALAAGAALAIALAPDEG
jgi:hypothetical protein